MRLIHQIARSWGTTQVVGGVIIAALACSAHPTEPKPARAGLAVGVGPPFHPDMGRLQIGGNPVLYELGPADFINAPYEMPWTGSRPLPTHGTLRMRASLVHDGDTLATGTITHELRPGYSYSVRIHVDSSRTTFLNSFCYIDILAVPVRRPGSTTYIPGDTMFVVHFERPPVVDPDCGRQGTTRAA